RVVGRPNACYHQYVSFGVQKSGQKHMTNYMQRRVVITGLGVLAANGTGKTDFWQASITGQSGIRRITRFDASPLPTQIAGEIANFDPQALGLTQEECSSLDRGTQLALAA